MLSFLRTRSSLYLHNFINSQTFYFTKKVNKTGNQRPSPLPNAATETPNELKQYQNYRNAIANFKQSKDYKGLIQTAKKYMERYPVNIEITKHSLNEQWNAFFESKQWPSALSVFKQAFDLEKSLLRPEQLQQTISQLSQQFLQTARNPISPGVLMVTFGFSFVN